MTKNVTETYLTLSGLNKTSVAVRTAVNTVGEVVVPKEIPEVKIE